MPQRGKCGKTCIQYVTKYRLKHLYNLLPSVIYKTERSQGFMTVWNNKWQFVNSQLLVASCRLFEPNNLMQTGKC